MEKEGNITWQGSQGVQGSAPPRELGLVNHRHLVLLPNSWG